MPTRVPVYLECGAKRTFAGALEWPGWCRHGPGEADALAALFAYGRRYASILKGTRLGFVAPRNLADLVVVERLPGNATTDFGAPAIAPAADHDRSCDAAELQRFEKILRAGWQAFDAAVAAAQGVTLTTGPRGGGRSLEGIVAHVLGADAQYLSAVGWKAPKKAEPGDRDDRAARRDSGGDEGLRGRRDPGPGPARRHALDSPLFRPPCRLACVRTRLGDRASCGVEWVALSMIRPKFLTSKAM